MDENTITLVVGLSGIASTLIVSALGLYYTSKSRSAPLRESLFSKQIDTVIQIVHLQSRIRVFLTILDGKDPSFKEQARADLADYFRRFSEIEEQAAAVLPVELWAEVKQLSSAISEAIGEYDTQNPRHDRIKSIVARMTKIALLSRTVIGTDELTEQSLALFSSQADYERIANLEIENFTEMYAKANRIND